MRKMFVVLLLSVFCIGQINAQFPGNHAIYASGELNFGNYFGGDVGLNYVYKEKYALKLGYTGNLRRAKSLPDDYSDGAIGVLLFGSLAPRDVSESVGLSFGRVFELHPSGTIRFVPSLGVSYTSMAEPVNWEKEFYEGLHLIENYNYDYEFFSAFSLIVNPRFEFPITPYWGLTFSPVLQTNKDRTYVGIGFGTIIGILREKK